MNFRKKSHLCTAWLIVAATLTLWLGASQSYGGSDDRPDIRKSIQAQQINHDPPQLDGILDDEAWQDATFISGFTQKDPNEGEPAMHRTEVAFLFDADALYVGARMYHANPAEIQAFVTRRDNAGNSERIIISLDTYRDRRTAYSFAVTAAGVRVDYYHPADHEFDREYRYNPVWDAEVAMTSDGWTAEMRIPFSQLRFNRSDEQVWGVNINRWIPNTNEDLYWVLIRKDDTGWASKFGELTGISGIKPSRRIELLPYVASSGTFTSNVDPSNPFTDGSEFKNRFGTDLKMGVGPNLTLDATFNPDFGQVEADPAVVNLSAFEVSFPERRPFFTEGNQLFDNNGPTYFYSRRIGAPPRGRVQADFVSRPDETTILGAAKLTGRLRSGLSIGALTAVTSSEHAQTFTSLDSTEAVRDEVKVEPATGYGILRLQQEFGESASTVGAMFTGMRRDLSDGEPLAAILNRQAYGGISDWNLRFEGGKYELSGFAGFSYIEGEPEAMVRAQRSSARYFQRPDATHVELDSSRTSMLGYTASLSVEKNSGEHWLWDVGFSAESPKFELNDVGILFSTDEISSWGQLTYRETQPGKLFRDYAFELAYFQNWNFEGISIFSILDSFFSFTLKNFWRSTLHFHYRPETTSPSLTRGGPLMGAASDWHLFGELSNSHAARLNWNFFTSYVNDNLGGWSFESRLAFSMKPADQWELSLAPVYARSKNTRQYFGERSDGRPETFGNRYIFSTIDRSTIATQIRLNFAITPDLSLELYAEPFASSGRWYNLGELLQPRSSDLLLYGTNGTTITRNADGSFSVGDGEGSGFDLPNRDFNVRSFRSNVVLRWEWRRGSTLFLVWQQDRFSNENHGRRVNFGSQWDGLSADGDNFLALKVSYWLPIN